MVCIFHSGNKIGVFPERERVSLQLMCFSRDVTTAIRVERWDVVYCFHLESKDIYFLFKISQLGSYNLDRKLGF